MREIDEVRIVLLRLLSDTAQFPSALIDQILKASEFVKRHMASIKVNAYGRGLLTRYRQHRLYVKNFNREANHQKALWAGIGYPLEDLEWDDIRVDEQGIRALRRTRAYRTSRRRLQKSVVDTSKSRDNIGFYNWGNVGPWYRDARQHFLTQARTNWWNSRNQLGVKLLDFGEP